MTSLKDIVYLLWCSFSDLQKPQEELDGKACAAVGQSSLMALYDTMFSQVGTKLSCLFIIISIQYKCFLFLYLLHLHVNLFFPPYWCWYKIFRGAAWCDFFPTSCEWWVLQGFWLQKTTFRHSELIVGFKGYPHFQWKWCC